MTLGSTQRLTDRSTRNLPGGKRLAANAAVFTGQVLHHNILHGGVSVYHRNVPHGAAALTAWRVRHVRTNWFHGGAPDTTTGK
jgi:hypothetical protein